MEVDVITTQAGRVAYLAREGPLDRVGDLFTGVQGWAESQGHAATPLIGVFIEHRQPLDEHGNPKGASVGRCEAWLHVESDIEPPEGDDVPAVKDVPPVRVARVQFEGNPEDLLRFSDQLRRFLRRHGLAPTNETRHVYHRADWTNVRSWTVEVQVVLAPGTA